MSHSIRTGGVLGLHRNNTYVTSNYDYNVLNMRRHPCVCADTYAGISNHTTWQRGKPSSCVEFSTQDIARPKPPGAVEERVRVGSTHLVKLLLRRKPGDGDANAQRRYNKLSRVYVVANCYEQATASGEHTDSNPLYDVHPQQEAVIRCNMVADGSCGFHPQRMPTSPKRQATYPLSG